MQKSKLSAIALGLVLLIILFALITQRMMLSWDGNLEDGQTKIFPEFKNLSFLINQVPFTHRGSSYNIQTVKKPNSVENITSHLKTNSWTNTTTVKENKPQHETTSTKPKPSAKADVISHLKDKVHVFRDPFALSPRNGTDISNPHKLALLKCPNQSNCIIPNLQLNRKFKIYFCKHPVSFGVRFYYLAKEAFLLHPNAILLDENHIQEADFIIYLPGSAPWHKTECSNSTYARKLIVLDEFDGHSIFSPYSTMDEMVKHYPRYKRTGTWYFTYFKRSFVSRVNGTFLNYPHLTKPDVFPLVYSIAEAYIRTTYNFIREIDILCTLRGSTSQLTRKRVQEWVSEYALSRKVDNYISGEVNTMSRTTVSKQYFEKMYNARIIVTVNPANWEGDFRLWEAFATGALVMVDPVLVPHPYPLIDGVHVVYFSNRNKTDLWSKLDYYRTHREEAKEIAIAGYLHTMKFHRAANLADYILRTSHLKRAKRRKARGPKYSYTGQYLNEEAAKQLKKIKSSQYPGDYAEVL
eukprot:gene9536-19831_t